MAANSAQVAVSDVRSPVVDASQDDNRADFSALVVNNGANSAYLGGDNVTVANGFELKPGASVGLSGTASDTVQAVCEATQTTRLDVLYAGVR